MTNISREVRLKLRDYFAVYPGEIVEAEWTEFCSIHPDFGIGISALRSYRTRLIKNRILEPTEGEREKLRKEYDKRLPGTPLGSLLRTLAGKKNARNRKWARP